MIPFDHPLCDHCTVKRPRLFATYEKEGARPGGRYLCDRHAATYLNPSFSRHVPLHELPRAAEARKLNKTAELSAQQAKALRDDPSGKGDRR